MYPDYNYMNEYNGFNFEPRNIQTQEKNDEIITLQEALELIKKSVGDEKEDEMFYDEIIRQAQTEKEKEIIKSIRDDERKHNKILRELYFKFTGQMLPDKAFNSTDSNINTIMSNSYMENLEKALFGELNAVVKYRRILGAMPDHDSYILIMSIMTDELRHSSKYNFLIHIAKNMN